MLRPFRIPLTLGLAVLTLLSAGEIATGTRPIFVAYMIGTLLCIGATYNELGGVSSIGGIAFTGLALCTIVISQIAKVILWEAADKTLQSAQLTIQVYFVFYLCLLVGVFAFRRLRFKGPRPFEPRSAGQENLQYTVTFVVGLIATYVYEVCETSLSASVRSSTLHSFGLAFSPLLLISLVLAVQAKIVRSDGLHSFGVLAFIPSIITVVFGLIETTRSRIILPALLYVFTCWVNGYRLRVKHYLVLGAGCAAFVFLISPFEVFVRGPMRELEFQDRIYGLYGFVREMPEWSVIETASRGGIESGSVEDYYERPGTSLLSRLSVIQADSNIINACAGGFHYGFSALKLDIARLLPRFVVRDKPDSDGSSYTGRVTGMNPDEVENGEFLITAIGDSYGAFGWTGVIVVSLLVIPGIFAVYESLFEISKPWGTLAAGSFCFVFSEADMGKLLGLTLRSPVAILFLSYCTWAIVRVIPMRGERQSVVSGGAMEGTFGSDGQADRGSIADCL